MIASRSIELHDLARGSTSRVAVVELEAADTHDLRRRVLRSSSPSAEVTFDGDERATTVHLGIVIDDAVVAVSTWLQAPFADRPEATAVQLRGMATEPTMQGRGLGAALLAAGVERARTGGADVVWARARSTAVAFYLAHGFVAVGDEFVDATTGLPHVIVLRAFDRPD